MLQNVKIFKAFRYIYAQHLRYLYINIRLSKGDLQMSSFTTHNNHVANNLPSVFWSGIYKMFKHHTDTKL